jgi:hypothetical protein
MAEIIGEIQTGELDIKRLYLPGLVIRDTCPNCGKECSNDLGEVSTSYPVINAPTTYTLYCGDGCEHEWEIPIVIDMKIRLAP